MKKIILIIILLTTLATSSFAQNVDEDYPGNKPGDNLFQNTFFTKEVETKNYLVISGFAKHFSNALMSLGNGMKKIMVLVINALLRKKIVFIDIVWREDFLKRVLVKLPLM